MRISWYKRIANTITTKLKMNNNNTLSLSTLRAANLARIPEYRNRRGELLHPEGTSSNWAPAEYLAALTSELGEYADWLVKYRRGDISREKYITEASKELADIVITLDLLCIRALDLPGEPHPTGINLAEVTVKKFNEVTERVGAKTYIFDDEVVTFKNDIHEVETT